MTDLPQTDDPPSADAGYDPARVEEAFSAFAERVHELETVAGELRAELQALRAERPAPTRFDDERWPVEQSAYPSPAHPSPDWIAAVPAPLARGLTVPRLALEGVFLLVVALLAGLADLAAVWIVLVMVAAWTLVALSEWGAAATRERWRLGEIAAPLGDEVADTTGPWDMPVVEATVIEAGPDPESRTMVTKLPADPVEAEPEEIAESAAAPRRRRGLRRWRQPPEAGAEAGAADPWET
ncbi:MAG: hypothetical protein ABIR67_13395 [Gaiellaceae bacterium]